MRTALPVAQGKRSSHFGYCEKLLLFAVDRTDSTIFKQHVLEPGVFPPWPQEQVADVVIAGGMGSPAPGLFEQQDIQVVIGAGSEEPKGWSSHSSTAP